MATRCIRIRMFAKALPGDRTSKTILLAEKLGVPVVIDFSGCPGDSDNAKYPNWVTCPWPPEYLDVLEWQWEKKVTPYWTEHGKVRRRPRREDRDRDASRDSWCTARRPCCGCARSRAIDRLQLRSEPYVLAGDRSRSRRFACWAIAIFHVHAKDTQIYESQPADDRRAGYQEVHRRAQPGVDFPHRAATAMAPNGGANSFRRCGCSATTTCFRSSMRTA